jgi:glycosyltransferase involved in cell wall biosynthesis
MAYVIIGDTFTFPEGDAATNRVYTYAKGFLENNLKIHVICFGTEYNGVGDGILNGIYYYHPFGIRERSKYFIVRRWFMMIRYFKTAALTARINKDDKIIAFHCYTSLLKTQLFAFILSRYFKSKLMLERSEHPMRNYNDKVLKRMYGNLRVGLETKICDGILCISNFLINFYKSRGLSERKLFLIPSTVDAERFSNHFNSPFTFKYILYCGSLTIVKDGVDILIESYSKISGKHPGVNLVLVGEADTAKDELFFRDLVSKFKMNQKVFFTGKLPRTAIPAYLCNAEILTLARPRSIVADAGFPSKVTEYLATGKPVVVTKVGDIPVYLKENENAFLSEPDSVDAFAEKLDYVLSNYELAKKVGEKGRELTATVFNYNFQAKRMIEFINNSLS